MFQPLIVIYLVLWLLQAADDRGGRSLLSHILVQSVFVSTKEKKSNQLFHFMKLVTKLLSK